jgi:alpha-tubulin suppressor-like RCC1 family protein
VLRLGAGNLHTCGLTPGGAVYCWGVNGLGELGDGTQTDRLTPAAVAMPTGMTFASLSTGGDHTCGRTPTGAAYCWGDNASGELGDGTQTNRLTPVAVTLPAGVTFASLSAGRLHTCGLTPGGAIYCWGLNGFGELGDGTQTDRLTPVAVAMPTGMTFASLSAGGDHTCGLTPTGAAYCWGDNGFGELGDGTQTNRLTPVAVTLPAGVTFARLSAGGLHTCGLTPAGATYCWGNNFSGELGVGGTPTGTCLNGSPCSSVPLAVTMPAGVTFASLSAGQFHTCGSTAAGAAYCWGDNTFGQLGDGTTTNRLMPMAVANP